MNNHYIYILTNNHNNVLYIGVTSNIIKRIWEHKNKIVKGFTAKYNVNKLVYYESTESIESAIAREKQLKRWHKKWKEDLINKNNPTWKDLYESLI